MFIEAVNYSATFGNLKKLKLVSLPKKTSTFTKLGGI